METTDALLAIGAILAAFAAVYFVARNHVVRRNLVCPRTGATAEVDLVRRSEGRQKPVRIRACSLFADPREIDCEQDCLSLSGR